MNNIFVIVLIIVLVVFYIQESKLFENFSNSDTKSENNVTINVFVSNSCGHCINYNKNIHASIVQYAESKNYTLNRIFSGSDENADNLFKEHNIEYVPACVITKGDKTVKMDKQITVESIDSTIEDIYV